DSEGSEVLLQSPQRLGREGVDGPHSTLRLRVGLVDTGDVVIPRLSRLVREAELVYAGGVGPLLERLEDTRFGLAHVDLDGHVVPSVRLSDCLPVRLSIRYYPAGIKRGCWWILPSPPLLADRPGDHGEPRSASSWSG